MRRRDLLAFLWTAAIGSKALAQAVKPRLALLSPVTNAALWDDFWGGMRALGHNRDDFVVDARSAEGRRERLPDLAGELVRLRPEIIVCRGSEAGAAAKQVTSTIPIVLAVSADPVGAGLVETLARPGGNVTGLSLASPDLAGKHVQLFREIVPDAQRLAVLFNLDDPTHPGRAAAVTGAARSVGINATAIGVRSAGEIAAAFAQMRNLHADGLIVLGTAVFR